MAIRRCPYCKAIIDESQKYCNNCGTQLLFPDDDPNEEPIKGEKIIDDDFPGGTGGGFSDIPEDREKDEDEVDLDESEEREEIDLEKVIEGERVLPGDVEPDAFIDLREAEGPPAEPKEAEEPPVIEEPVIPDEEALAPVMEVPAEPSEAEKPVRPAPPPVRTRGRRKKSPAAEPPPSPPVVSAPVQEKSEEPEIVEEAIVPSEDKAEGDVLPLLPPIADDARLPSILIGSDTHDEIARLIADFEIRRRGLSVEGETDLAPAEDDGPSPSLLTLEKPIGDEPAEAVVEPEEKEISVEEQRPGLEDEAQEIGWNRIEPPDAEDVKDKAEGANSEKDEDREMMDERLPSFLGESTEFQDEDMKQMIPGSSSDPTMGIPETVTKLQEALPFGPLSDEIEIERELEAIAPPDATGARKNAFRHDDFDLERDLVREAEAENESDEDSEEEDEAEDSGGREGGKIPAARSIVRLGFFRRVKALLFDLLIVAVFWVVATGLAAGFLSVPILDLVAAASVPLALLFGALLTAYLFLFLFFLGETPGGRLVTPKDVSSAG